MLHTHLYLTAGDCNVCAMGIDDDIRIRRYEDRDLDPLIGLIQELQAHELSLFDRMKHPDDIGEAYVADLQCQCREQAGQILIAEHRGHLAGYAAVMTNVVQDDADEVAYTYALISEIAVTRRYRGKGLGRRLLGECERHAVAAGTRWLRIGVLAGNTGAHRLYRKFGFEDRLIDLEKPLNN